MVERTQDRFVISQPALCRRHLIARLARFKACHRPLPQIYRIGFAISHDLHGRDIEFDLLNLGNLDSAKTRTALA
ncbi:hypothetical protein NKH80_02050 [Mesorhizobium sp. M0904]|uniref:hypothetical protein n=1 Tax=unclassified Mesorhizobium TaxID=325217 RepID=UPI0033378157